MKSNSIHFTDILASFSANTTRSSTTISGKRSACVILVRWLQLDYGTRLVPTMSSVNVPRSRVSKRLSLECTPNSILFLPSRLVSFSQHIIIPCTDPPSPPLLFPNQSALSFLESILTHPPTFHILHVFQHLTFWPIHPQPSFITRLHIKLNSSRLI